MQTLPAGSVDYWTDSRRPLASLLFLLPLLAIYEAGIWLIGDAQVTAVRNGADTWLRSGLLQVGLDRPWALPLLIVAGLVSWQVVRGFPWRTSPETFIGMGAESLLGAIVLLVMGQCLCLTLRRFGCQPAEMVDASVSPAAATAIGFLGAGIYEEVLFRLLLLPGVYLLLRTLLLSRRASAAGAVVLTSLVFALAHYVEPGPHGSALHPQSFVVAAQSIIESPQAWFGFSFRLMAGLVFAAMFVLRGFGITVGCHAIYDLLVGLLLAM